MEHKLFIDGQWTGDGPSLDVRNKHSGELIGSLPTARSEDVAAAKRAAPVMADMPAHKRSEILSRTAAMIRERSEDLARTIAAEEAKRIHGETVPLDALPAGEGYFGYRTKWVIGNWGLEIASSQRPLLLSDHPAESPP